jgi:hypothetical protein
MQEWRFPERSIRIFEVQAVERDLWCSHCRDVDHLAW